MCDPYFVSDQENLSLEIKACEAYVIVNINGKETTKVEGKDAPIKMFLTKGLKRSDKNTVHHAQVQLWNKTPGYSIDASIYSIDPCGGEQKIKTFKAEEKGCPSEQENISEFYLSLVQSHKPVGNVKTENFYFQFD